MKKYIKPLLFMTISASILLVGCNNVQDNDTSNKKTNKNTTTTISNKEKNPPTLNLTIGGIDIKTHRGAYNWSYLDKKTGQEVTTQTDTLSPTQMLSIEQAIHVNLSEPIVLEFEKEPTTYEIKIWEDNKTIKTYHSFEEIKEKGKYIIEIVGYWGDSRVGYVIALDIQ